MVQNIVNKLIDNIVSMFNVGKYRWLDGKIERWQPDDISHGGERTAGTYSQINSVLSHTIDYEEGFGITNKVQPSKANCYTGDIKKDSFGRFYVFDATDVPIPTVYGDHYFPPLVDIPDYATSIAEKSYWHEIDHVRGFANAKAEPAISSHMWYNGRTIKKDQRFWKDGHLYLAIKDFVASDATFNYENCHLVHDILDEYLDYTPFADEYNPSATYDDKTLLWNKDDKCFGFVREALPYEYWKDDNTATYDDPRRYFVDDSTYYYGDDLELLEDNSRALFLVENNSGKTELWIFVLPAGETEHTFNFSSYDELVADPNCYRPKDCPNVYSSKDQVIDGSAPFVLKGFKSTCPDDFIFILYDNNADGSTVEDYYYKYMLAYCGSITPIALDGGPEQASGKGYFSSICGYNGPYDGYHVLTWMDSDGNEHYGTTSNYIEPTVDSVDWDALPAGEKAFVPTKLSTVLHNLL